jgi:hypothetical protein
MRRSSDKLQQTGSQAIDLKSINQNTKRTGWGSINYIANKSEKSSFS